MNNPFSRFFREEDVETNDAAVRECHEVLEFSRTMYYPKFVAYLDREIDKPWVIGNEMTMVQSAARVNAFKEIRAHLRKQVDGAARLIAASEEPNG